MYAALKRVLRQFVPSSGYIPLPEPASVRDERIARMTVARNARGNIRLVSGFYVTKKDIDRAYDRIKDVTF
ncbi:MAG: hypothetical protein ABT940_09085 [Alphaproteobacteria bacterium]